MQSLLYDLVSSFQRNGPFEFRSRRTNSVLFSAIDFRLYICYRYAFLCQSLLHNKRIPISTLSGLFLKDFLTLCVFLLKNYLVLNVLNNSQQNLHVLVCCVLSTLPVKYLVHTEFAWEPICRYPVSLFKCPLRNHLSLANLGCSS